jgi:hypothetical protein
MKFEIKLTAISESFGSSNVQSKTAFILSGSLESKFGFSCANIEVAKNKNTAIN